MTDKERYQKNREAFIERSRQWQKDNPERHKENVRRWKEKNPDRVKRHRRNIMWKQKGVDMDIARYEALLSEQKGVCAICKQPPKKRQLAVDHDHETGRIRGLLCYECNVGLGHFERLGRFGLKMVESYLNHKT